MFLAWMWHLGVYVATVGPWGLHGDVTRRRCRATLGAGGLPDNARSTRHTATSGHGFSRAAIAEHLIGFSR